MPGGGGRGVGGGGGGAGAARATRTFQGVTERERQRERLLGERLKERVFGGKTGPLLPLAHAKDRGVLARGHKEGNVHVYKVSTGLMGKYV